MYQACHLGFLVIHDVRKMSKLWHIFWRTCLGVLHGHHIKDISIAISDIGSAIANASKTRWHFWQVHSESVGKLIWRWPLQRDDWRRFLCATLDDFPIELFQFCCLYNMACILLWVTCACLLRILHYKYGSFANRSKVLPHLYLVFEVMLFVVYLRRDKTSIRAKNKNFWNKETWFYMQYKSYACAAQFCSWHVKITNTVFYVFYVFGNAL